MNHYIEFTGPEDWQLRAVLADGAVLIEDRHQDAMGAPSWRLVTPDDLPDGLYGQLLEAALVEAIRTNAEVQA